MSYIVYCHTNIINGKQYIGITSSTLEERCGTNGTRYRNCVAFWGAIQKYGWDNFAHKILAYDLTRAQACELEIHYIAEYNTLVPNGYNLSVGGDANQHTESWRNAMSIKMKGNKNCIGRKWTKSQTVKMSAHMKNNDYGKYHKVTPEYIERVKLSQPNRVIVQQFTQQGQLLKEYCSIGEAARQTGIESNNIGKASKGLLKSAGGYIWKRRGQ